MGHATADLFWSAPLGPWIGVKMSNKIKFEIQSKQGCKDQESGIQSSNTPDPGYQWESDKLAVRHFKREPKGQPFPSS